MINTKSLQEHQAKWVPGAHMYHVTPECFAQMTAHPELAESPEGEAQARGMRICPDCRRRTM